TYRYLLREIELNVDGVRVESIDPLFLDPQARYFMAENQGGAQQTLDEHIAVKYVRDEETGDIHLLQVGDASELREDDPNLLAAGAIRVRLSRFPYGFASESADASNDAKRRLDIRKSRRGMSFVRANREIETVDVFPKSVKDEAKGLG